MTTRMDDFAYNTRLLAPGIALHSALVATGIALLALSVSKVAGIVLVTIGANGLFGFIAVPLIFGGRAKTGDLDLLTCAALSTGVFAIPIIIYNS